MQMGKILFLAGIALASLGVVLMLFPGLFSWFGKLPGDIRAEGQGSVIFVPFSSMIVLSILASVLLSLIGRYLGR